MSCDIERWEPLNDPTAFESLCLELWKDFWPDAGAQKNGRRGQRQDGVDMAQDRAEAQITREVKRCAPLPEPAAT